jgi:hypothetical protein
VAITLYEKFATEFGADTQRHSPIAGNHKVVRNG